MLYKYGMLEDIMNFSLLPQFQRYTMFEPDVKPFRVTTWEVKKYYQT
jgi:hypothetical protein